MVRPGRDMLAGEVEVDETYVEGAQGLGERSKRVASGRIRLARIKDCSEAWLTYRARYRSGSPTPGWVGVIGCMNALDENKALRVLATWKPA